MRGAPYKQKYSRKIIPCGLLSLRIPDNPHIPKASKIYHAGVITHWLFLFLLLLSLYDLRTGKIPNWTTLPLLGLGIILYFPGNAQLWLGCILLFAAWRSGQMGAGDAKLWMVLFWLLPSDERFLLFFFLSLLLTATLQIGYRQLAHKSATGVRSPAAWRTIPYLLLIHYAG